MDDVILLRGPVEKLDVNLIWLTLMYRLQTNENLNQEFHWRRS